VVLTHSHNEVEDGDKSTDGIRITSKHNVAEADIIVSGDMASSYSCEG